MDKENFFYLKSELEADDIRLKENIEKQIEQEFKDRQLNHINKSHQNYAASQSPAFTGNRQEAIESTNKNIETKEEILEKEKQTRRDELYNEGRKILEECHFEQWGGSYYAAEKMVFAKDNNTHNLTADFNRVAESQGIEK